MPTRQGNQASSTAVVLRGILGSVSLMPGIQRAYGFSKLLPKTRLLPSEKSVF